MIRCIKCSSAILAAVLILTGCNPSKEEIRGISPNDLNVTVHIDDNTTQIPVSPIDDNDTAVPISPQINTIIYKESDEIFKNPERGLYALRYMSDVPYRSTHTEPSALDWISSGPYTTFRMDLVLAGSRNSSISQNYLEKVKKQFELIRKAGLKTILRVTYNEHRGDDDTDVDRAISHMRELKPILEENKDIIMAIGAGYIGAWGEWHSSTHNLTTAENMKKIEKALMQNTPKELKIMFRQPKFLMSWYPTALTDAEANSKTDKSRAGFHDDCFAWNYTDMGTFSRDADTKDDQFRYLEQITKYTPVVGEMCTADVANESNTVSCESGIDMAKRFHYSLLGDQIRGEWTTQEKLPVELYKEQGCWDEFQRRLGYRFVLKEAKIPKTVKSGSDLKMSLRVANVGFSATVNERPVYLVLSNNNTEYKFKINTDPRKWYGGEEKTLDITQKLPSNLEAGDYDIYLWMPDKSQRLQSNPKYSIRVANESVWVEEKGYNKIGTIMLSKKIDQLSITALSFSETPENLVFKMEGIFPTESHHDLYIDADNDAHTGYSKGGISGADYLIEDGRIYRYPNGANGWKWTRMDAMAQIETTQHNAMIHIPKDALSLAQTIRVGASVGVDDFSRVGYYPKMLTFSLKKKDTTPPIITLKGADTITLAVGDTYIEQGATAQDDVDGMVNVDSKGDVDTDTPGSYTVTYTATDAAGNRATVTRRVRVVVAPSGLAKIFLIGDSTVHNHDLPDGHGSYRELGWGDVLDQFIKEPSNLYNGARSGASSTSYRQSRQGRHDWGKTVEKIKQSDLTHGGFLLIQFGHNDESNEPSLHTDPGRGESYYMALKYYIDQARALDLTPILVSPVQRQKRTHDHIGYADTVRALAEDENVHLLDLTEKSYEVFAAYDSNEAIHAKFGYDDTTHFNPWGARQVASWVRDLACEQPESRLCKQFQFSALGETTVSFEETPLALKNPLKGFMIYPNGQSPREFVSLYKRPIAWNRIEQNINDGVDKIRTYANSHLFYSDVTKKRVEEQNIKSIPIVILKKGRSDDFSPDDMSISEHDNQTEVFADRVKNLVEKLGKAWDEDPRIGFIYMGIVGTWGEQFDPNVSSEMAKVLGDSFQKAFLHKKVLVRLPGYFNESYLSKHNHRFLGKTYNGGFSFGMYWDAFGWEKELTNALDTQGVIKTPMWKTEPMLGEVAFNVDSDYIYNTVSGSSKHSGDPIHDTLAHKDSLKYIEDYIRITHATALSWIADYNANDAAENVAAHTLQKIMGYRFVLQNASYTKTVDADRKLHVKCSVKNVGSAPFYYRWPLKVSLLEPETKKLVWSGTFSAVDIRSWLPGDNWDREENRYKIPAQTYMAEQEFDLPETVDEGEYILALSINDPAGDKPSVRFANKRYLKGGWIPVGMIGVGANPTDTLPVSDELQEDKLSYRLDIN